MPFQSIQILFDYLNSKIGESISYMKSRIPFPLSLSWDFVPCNPTRSKPCWVSENDLELVVLLSLPPECCDCGCVSSCPGLWSAVNQTNCFVQDARALYWLTSTLAHSPFFGDLVDKVAAVDWRCSLVTARNIRCLCHPFCHYTLCRCLSYTHVCINHVYVLTKENYLYLWNMMVHFNKCLHFLMLKSQW